MAFINIYPVYTSQELAFKSKQNTMQSQAAVIASTLSGLETLNSENVGKVLELLDIGNLTRTAITNQSALILYDTESTEASQPRYAIFPELIKALDGYDVFNSVFADSAFHSSVTVPVMHHNSIIGCVYIYEYDGDQGALLVGVQMTFRNISLVVGALVLVICVILSRGLTSRISRILAAMRIVREGEYSHRMDISGSDELAELGREFNRLTDRLETTEEMRRRFVSDASHELKTPLASIRLLTDSILQTQEMDPATTREFVADIGAEAERLSRMSEKLLSLTRLSGVKLETVPVRLSQVIETAAHMLRPLAGSAQIEIELDLDEDAVTLADPDDMHQIIFNLVENAIKYNHPGGKVRVRLFSYGKLVEIMVEDNGIGIPEEDLPRIFERFYRVEKARSRETGGSGIGLSIVADTVARYNGTVSAERSSIGGMCFCVKLPAYMEGKS